MSDAKGEDKGEELEFEPFEEQPDIEPLEGEPLEADLPPLEEGSDEAEGAVPADALAEDAPPVEEDEVTLPSEVLEEEGEEEEVASPGEEELAEPPEEGEEGEAEKEKGEKKKKKGRSLIEAVKSASPYTVMLVVAFFALLLGILCLAVELGRYDWDFKAEGAKRGSAFAPVFQRPAPTDTPVAFPRAEKLNIS